MDGKIDIENHLNQNLKRINGLTYNNNEIDLNDANKKITNLPATVKLYGYAFTISENGDVDKIQWIDNNNGSYTNAETGQTLTVGDTVKYETILNANADYGSKLTTLRSDLANYSGNSSSTDNSGIDRDSLTWKVLDVKDGKIRLISTVPTTKKIELSSANGYNNAVYLIDKACDTLYSIDRVGTAQNLKIEDIEGTLTYDYTQYANSYVDTGKYGGTKEYTKGYVLGLQYPNIYSSEVGCKAIATADNTDNTLGLSSQSRPVTGSSTATSRLKVTQTYWSKSMASTDFTDSKYYPLFINNGSNLATYWLSSRCVTCGDINVSFRVRRVGGGYLHDYIMFDNVGNTYGTPHPFRPVVSLKSDIQLSGSSSEGWMIQ